MKEGNRLRAVGLAFVILFLASCYPIPVGGPPGSYDPGYAGPSGRWIRLGAQEVNFGIDRDSVRIPRVRGPMRQLMVLARVSPVEVYDIRVVFTNGTSYDAAHRQRLNTGSDRIFIDLPGVARSVREVIFRYRKLAPASRRAIIELYGR